MKIGIRKLKKILEEEGEKIVRELVDELDNKDENSALLVMLQASVAANTIEKLKKVVIERIKKENEKNNNNRRA